MESNNIIFKDAGNHLRSCIKRWRWQNVLSCEELRERSACFWYPNAGIKGVFHHALHKWQVSCVSLATFQETVWNWMRASVMVGHAWNQNTQGIEREGWWFWGQNKIHREILSPNNKKHCMAFASLFHQDTGISQIEGAFYSTSPSREHTVWSHRQLLPKQAVCLCCSYWLWMGYLPKQDIRKARWWPETQTWSAQGNQGRLYK